MKMITNRIAVLSLLLVASTAVPQQAVAPPPKPADSGPSLAETVQFIEEKLTRDDQLGYQQVFEVNDGDGTSTHTEIATYKVTQARFDATGCSLTFTTHTSSAALREDGTNAAPFAQELSHTIPLKAVETLKVLTLHDSLEANFLSRGISPPQRAFTPEIWVVKVYASRPSITSSYPGMTATPAPDKNVDFLFVSGEQAARVAKAMTHAVELCGGGNKEPF